MVSGLCGYAPNEIGSNSKRCSFVESLESFSDQALDDIVAGVMKNNPVHIFRLEKQETDLEAFCNRRIFRVDEVVDCSTSKKLKVSARKMLGFEAFSK